MYAKKYNIFDKWKEWTDTCLFIWQNRLKSCYDILRIWQLLRGSIRYMLVD